MARGNRLNLINTIAPSGENHSEASDKRQNAWKVIRSVWITILLEKVAPGLLENKGMKPGGKKERKNQGGC